MKNNWKWKSMLESLKNNNLRLRSTKVGWMNTEEWKLVRKVYNKWPGCKVSKSRMQTQVNLALLMPTQVY